MLTIPRAIDSRLFFLSYASHQPTEKTSRLWERTARAPYDVLGVPAYPSGELGIGESGHVREGALDERKPVPLPTVSNTRVKWGCFYRSSSCNSSRWSVSSALRFSLSSASSLTRAMSSTRAQNASVPAFSSCTTSQHNTGTREETQNNDRTPLWNCARSSRLRRSNSPDFLNLCVFFDWSSFCFCEPECDEGRFTL